jgi:hypothetical protein
MLVLVSNWQGDPSRALLHTGRGLERLAPGQARIRILQIPARASALQRNPAAVAASLARAEADRDASEGQWRPA